jgi:hypothetical protein
MREESVYHSAFSTCEVLGKLLHRDGMGTLSELRFETLKYDSRMLRR